MKIDFPLVRTLTSVVVASLLFSCGGAPDYDNGDPIVGATPDPGTSSSSIKIGKGGGGSFIEGEANYELLDSGVSSASWEISVVVVDENNIAITDANTVNFTSSCVESGLASLDNTSVTTVAGRASVTYSSGSCNGIDTVVASLESGATANADLDIDANVDEGASGGGEIDETVRIGNGSGESFQEGVLTAGSTNLQAGGRTNVSASLVDSQGELITQSATVTFNSACAADDLASFGQSSVASTAGQVVTSYTATGCVGDDVVTVSANINGEDISASITLNVTADSVSGLEFVSVSQPVLALPGTGGTETTEVVFRLIGELGAPVLGESVSFQLTSSVGGVSIPSSRVSDISDAEGIISTLVQSGTVSTTLSVIATHDATGNQTTSDGIVVSSGVPVDSKFSIALSSFAPQEAYIDNGVEVDVRIIASDFFGNDVPDGSQVFFASPESGNIDASCMLESGECSVKWRSAGQRPADLRASIIAYTSGAEDFIDINGNTVFDAEDILGDDVGEPFIDEDENGVHDLGEFFVDANSNGVRDGANGFWDGPCLSAVNSAADCSGEDSVLLYKTAVIRMPTETARLISWQISFDSGETYSDLEAGAKIYTGNLGAATLRAVVGDSNELADEFGGHPLPEGTTLAYTLSASSGDFELVSDSFTVGDNVLLPSVISGFLQDKNEVESSAFLRLRVVLPSNTGTFTLATHEVIFDDPPEE